MQHFLFFFSAEQSFRKDRQPGEAKEKMGEQEDESLVYWHRSGSSTRHHWTYNLCYC